MGYWFVRVEIEDGAKAYIAHISDALREDDPLGLQYDAYHMKHLSIDPNHRDSPFEGLLKVQELFCEEQREKRHARHTAFQCGTCSGFFATQLTLNTHVGKKTCKKSNSISTPDKKRRTEGGTIERGDDNENVEGDDDAEWTERDQEEE